ncbi:MAG TPA: M14 family zinc carboxypeptidase [Actinomycetota bacterium]|nr:M14 family zinc carboxypeptidase [Actinomycetota bacterium]
MSFVRPRALLWIALALVAALFTGSFSSGVGATPVCADEPRAACGGRIFPEPDNSASFVQHDNGEYESGILALEKEYPRFFRATTFSELRGEESLSAGGREIWMIEITDFNAPEKGKVPVAASLSMHGAERAGLEGGVRYMEDLARWAAEEPDHELRNGTNRDSIGVPVSEVLKKVHFYLANINPDGWAEGDTQNAGVYQRGNATGDDLNREYPTLGWTDLGNTPLSEPETKYWIDLMNRIDPVITTDIHGEMTSANNAFADLMLPAGQWNPVEQAQVERLARHMASNVERYFEQQNIDTSEVMGQEGMKPAEYATGFDVVGYDASGFMGDWLTQQGAVDMDSEHFLSNTAPNSVWIPALEKAHVAAVRGELEAAIVEALVTHRVKPTLALGRVKYLANGKTVKSSDGYGGPKPPKKADPAPYKVNRIRYFRDLSKHARRPLRAVTPARLTRRGPGRAQTLVITGAFGKAFRKAAHPKRARRAATRSVKKFVKRGGNLVLTDGALKLLPKLGIVKKNAVGRRVFTAGHVTPTAWEDPYLRKVHHTASQTYYEVPLGYSLDDDTSPHWVVAQEAWEGAGGTSVAYVGEETDIALGRVKVGRGTVGIFGAILPDPTEKYDHLFGLADYAVSVAGGQILNNMMAFGRR